MGELYVPLCSISPTKRRRFLWAAWWSGPPERKPFRKPDAWSGGARTPEEAQREAERAAGQPLVVVEGSWARAWARVVRGEEPWPEARKDGAGDALRLSAGATPGPSIWALLGVPSSATAADIKRAFRRKALETHPDRGGEAKAFQAVREAYDEALRRSARPKRKRR